MAAGLPIEPTESVGSTITLTFLGMELDSQSKVEAFSR